ncbi:protein kinase [Streptomyces coeruleoprunus]|uniref:Protein kinase n=1 Tax=Streptomyces coeruleoprunus TaxID=285563 RepID=A0ABV9XMV0_9ACTN
MDDYAGRVLADRYRLPLPTTDTDTSADPYAYDFVETRAFDTYSGQEVLIRQLPLPETVDAEVVDADGPRARNQRHHQRQGRSPSPRDAYGRVASARAAADPAVRRAVEAAQAAAQIPDHPRLDQVFDVFAEAGSLWIVSELVPARPLAALIGEEPLTPYRAAEIASDLLTALRALHAHGWTHRNITVRTVLVCDDGRVMLTGLAVGAAEEALCGYAPVPLPDDEPEGTYTDGHDADGQAYGDDAHGGEAYGDEDYDAAPYGDDDAYDSHDPYDPQDPYDTGLADPADDAPGPHATDEGSGPHSIEPYRPRGLGPAPLPPGPPALPSGYEPQWVAEVADRIAEDEDDDAPRYGGPDDPGSGGPSRAMLAGSWRDGPVSAGGGSSPYGDVSPYGGTRAALRADSQRLPRQDARTGSRRTAEPANAPAAQAAAAAQAPASPRPHRGPATRLAAERARQARIAVVGAVTERWAPEQAGPVHDTWQLAPPIGPATDLWALGALLFRVLQGHAPYPEDNAAELVQMVCAEPPAFAEDCGPLRPVVESLLRQDPTERPDFEELRGWLRSLIRSAPEPDAGASIVPMPSADDARLPIVRRRGDLVRRRRPQAPAPVVAPPRHRHKKTRERTRGPRALGRMLLLLIFLALAAAVAYAMLFMPKAESRDQSQPTGHAGRPSPSAPDQQADPQASPDPRPTPDGGEAPSAAPSTNGVTPSAPALAAGYVVRDDPEGFRIGVDRTWRRSPINDVGQVRYASGDFTLIVVPGRDTVRTGGADPLEYQRTKERELQPWRDSSWASATGLRRVDVGRQAMAEGQFTWTDSAGREVYVRNLALVVGDRYHVVQVIGPDSQRDKVTEIYQQAIKVYRATR